LNVNVRSCLNSYYTTVYCAFRVRQTITMYMHACIIQFHDTEKVAMSGFHNRCYTAASLTWFQQSWHDQLGHWL
jgi:hypothetical protein